MCLTAPIIWKGYKRANLLQIPFWILWESSLKNFETAMPDSVWRSGRNFCRVRALCRGGLSIALSSETAAHTVMTTLAEGENLTTIELKNNFLSMVSKGLLIAESTVYKRGRQIVIVDFFVRSDQGKEISKSSAAMMVIPSLK